MRKPSDSVGCGIVNSLKSMPSTFTEGDIKPLSNSVVEGDGSLDVEAIEAAATWLRSKLGLTIIGFDIVVCGRASYHSHFNLCEMVAEWLVSRIMLYLLSLLKAMVS